MAASTNFLVPEKDPTRIQLAYLTGLVSDLQENHYVNFK